MRSAPLRDVEGVFQILNTSCKERKKTKKTRPIFGAILALQQKGAAESPKWVFQLVLVELNLGTLLHVR